MPAWRELTEVLAKIANIESAVGGPKVAGEFERQFGRVQLIEAIRKALHFGDAEPGKAHLIFVQLPFETIYTTNFDLLLEDAFLATHKPFRSIVGELQMPFHGGRLTPTIVKMHGDLRHEEHIIITSHDYDRYLTQYPVVATHLSAQLIVKTALFVGYSLTDPDFLHIRNIIKSRLGKFERMAYVVAFNSSQADIDEKLNDNLHVINLTCADDAKDQALEMFFREIQQQVDTQEAVSLRTTRPDVFEPLTNATVKNAIRTKDASQVFASASNLCFVLMPLRPEMEPVYQQVIKPAAESSGLTVLRADEIHSQGSIVEQIRSAIQQSRLCIADLSYMNPNVLYEVGIAHSINKPTILLARDRDRIPFDVASHRIIIYDINDLQQAQVSLESAIQNALLQGQLDEARHLLENGAYRAAVAVLSVLLEQGMRRVAAEAKGITFKVPVPRFSLGHWVTTLLAANILSTEEALLLRQAIVTRNRAVHELSQVSELTARDMFRIVSDFLRKWFPGQIQN